MIVVCREAIVVFNRMLQQDPSHHAWYNRELSLFVWTRLDDKLTSFNVDHELDARVKEGACKKTPRILLGSYGDYREPEQDDIPARAIPPSKQVEYQQLVGKISPISKIIQLRTAGFTPNARQHRMFGLAVLEIAQLLRNHLLGILHQTGPSMVPTNCSSKAGIDRSASTHRLGWRDLADIAVRWRQISEPNDTVWWIDRLPESAFHEGFGLQTPMFTAQMKTIR